MTDVQSVTGEQGNFNVTLVKRPRYIIEEKCTACNTCVEYCPVKYPDTFNQGISDNKAVHVYFAQAVPLVTYIDDSCLYLKDKKCRICEGVCKNGAIDFHQEPEEVKLNVGAIILASGLEPFDPDADAAVQVRALRQRRDQHGLRAPDVRHRPVSGRDPAALGPEAPTQGGLDPVRRFAAGDPRREQLLFGGVLHVHAEAGHPDQGARRRRRVHRLPQRRPLLRQGLRTLLPADRGPAGRALHPQLRHDRAGGPRDQERHHPVRHDRRGCQGRRVRHGRAVGGLEPAGRRPGPRRHLRHRTQRPRLQSGRGLQPHGDVAGRASSRAAAFKGPSTSPSRCSPPARRAPRSANCWTTGGGGWPRSESTRSRRTSRPRSRGSASSSATAGPTSAGSWGSPPSSSTPCRCPTSSTRPSSSSPAPRTRPRRSPTRSPSWGSTVSSSGPALRGRWSRCSGTRCGRPASTSTTWRWRTSANTSRGSTRRRKSWPPRRPRTSSACRWPACVTWSPCRSSICP